MDLVKYFIENSITVAIALFPEILTIFLYRYCKVKIKYICFILAIYIVIPIYVLYYTFTLDNLLYQFFALLSSYLYLFFENLYQKIKDKKDNLLQ